MKNGYIKLHRKLTEWEWYNDANTFRVFMHLLLMANYAPKRYRGHEIPVGSVVTGRKALAKALNISEQNVRTSLAKLKSTSEITIKVTNKFSVISIVNYREYQSASDGATSKTTSNLTNNQPTTNQQLTTPKESKKVKKEEVRSTPPIFPPKGGVAQKRNGVSKESILEVICYLNERSGKRYRAYDAHGELTASGRLVRDRLKTGVSVKQAKAVIAIQSHEWGGDETMEKYLRPSTLFRASNFENYLGKVGDLDD